MFEVRQTPAFENWLACLLDKRAQYRNSHCSTSIWVVGGCEGSWRRYPGDADRFGPGYRVYFVQKGKVLFVLLCGGVKGSQVKDIARAKVLARELED